MSAMSKSSSSSGRDEITTPPTATIGIRSEKRHLTCRLEKVAKLQQCEELIEGQKFQFQMGDSIGLPTTWSFFLEKDAEHGSIDAFFKVLTKPENVAAVYASYKVVVRQVNGEEFLQHQNECFKMPETGLGFGNLIDLKEDLKDVVQDDGSLLIEIDFELFSRVEDVDLAGKMEAFRVKSMEQLSLDLRQIFTMTEVNANAVTTIISKDKQEFPVNRGILAARSVVFQRMFQVEMSESTTGVVRIDDLTGKGVNVLLYYLCTGALHQDWKSPDVIEELTSAAHRYELDLLTAFLDDVLGVVCIRDNAMRLAILARTLGMKKAEMELFTFVKMNATGLEDFMLEPAKMSVENTDGGEVE